MASTIQTWLEQPREYDRPFEEVTRLTSDVTPEGDAAVFAVELGNSRHLNVKIPFNQIGAVENVIRQAGAKLVNRQALRLDSGMDALVSLIHVAQRPIAFDMFKDPFSEDLIFVYSFKNHAPMALRVNYAQCLENLAGVHKMIRAITN